MTAKDGKPCGRCGTNKWDKQGHCAQCSKERRRQWAQRNPEKMRESDRRYRQNNPERAAAITSRWQQGNQAMKNAHNRRRRTQKTQAGGSHTAAEWKDLCTHYGNKCLRCGREDVKLTADHVLPVSKGGSSNIDNMQPLCRPCNSAKKDRHIDYRPDAGPLRWLQAKLFG